MRRNTINMIVGALAILFTGSAIARGYEQVLSCDGGAAVVDVDKEYRQQLQLVVRQPAIVRYLYSRGIFDRSHLGPQRCVQDRGGLRCDPPREIIIQGRNQIVRGSEHDPGNLPGYPYYKNVFGPNDVALVDAGSGLGSRPTLKFFREGRGLKVQALRYIDGRCDGFISPSTGQCQGRYIPGYLEEIGNWYFQECQ
jgi:hypothetical protein